MVRRGAGTSTERFSRGACPIVLSWTVDAIIRVLGFLIHDDDVADHTSGCPTSSILLSTGCVLSPPPNFSQSSDVRRVSWEWNSRGGALVYRIIINLQCKFTVGDS